MDHNEMIAKIQKKRNMMIESANKKGLSNFETIRYSQELDQLIYEYQCQCKNVQCEEKLVSQQMVVVFPKMFIPV